MSRLLTLQDDSGGFEFAGNAFPIDPVPRNADIDDLKKVQTSNGISLMLFWDSFEKGNDKVQKSVHFCNMCCEFMVCVHVQSRALVNAEQKTKQTDESQNMVLL